MKLIFRVKAAGKDGKSPVEVILNKDKLVAKDTDQIIPTLDKLLKRNKIKVEDISSRNIKLEIDEKAGLTSRRITKSIIKALSLNL
jgi:hypothetical protein